MELTSTTARLQCWINRIQMGNACASGELLGHFDERLRRLTRKMLHQKPAVARWEQTDDVYQNVAVRLVRALETSRPSTVRDLFRLATTLIQHELIDLYRHHCGPHGGGAHHISTSPQRGDAAHARVQHEGVDTTNEPARLAEWTELHEKAAKLPDPEGEVFGLIYYHGLTQAESARVLGLSRRTVIRRWLSAQLLLREALGGGELDT